MALICPKCRSPLGDFDIEGVQIDQCATCHGTWFDGQELSYYLKAEAGTPAIELLEKNPKPTELSCPRCSSSLNEMSLALACEGASAVGADLRVDRCSGCKGVWLDGDEFPKAKNVAHALGESYQRMPRPTSDNFSKEPAPGGLGLVYALAMGLLGVGLILFALSKKEPPAPPPLSAVKTCQTCKGAGKIGGVCLVCKGSGNVVKYSKAQMTHCLECGASGRQQKSSMGPCAKCGGSGQMSAAPKACATCGGSGRVEGVDKKTCHVCYGTGHAVVRERCPTCGGAGRSDINTQWKCANCQGAGSVEIKKTCATCMGGIIETRAWKNCPICLGNGRGGSQRKTCDVCLGTGQTENVSADFCHKCQGTGRVAESGLPYQLCQACQGRGKTPDMVCAVCGGKGAM